MTVAQPAWTRNLNNGAPALVVRRPSSPAPAMSNRGTTNPPHGMTSGVVGTITPLVDLWVEERRLPAYYRAVNATDA